MTPFDYAAHILIHLLDNADTLNAKLLFQRVPEPLQADLGLKQAMQSVENLANSKYGEALKLLATTFQVQPAATSVLRKEDLESLQATLVWHLRVHTIPQVISKRYSDIPLTNVKAMLGAEQLNAVDFKKLIQSSDLLESDQPNAKGFVIVKSVSSQQANFRLTPERVESITEIVKFLERQKHDISAPVAEQRAIDEKEAKQDAALNQAKIQGKLQATVTTRGKK